MTQKKHHFIFTIQNLYKLKVVGIVAAKALCVLRSPQLKISHDFLLYWLPEFKTKDTSTNIIYPSQKIIILNTPHLFPIPFSFMSSKYILSFLFSLIFFFYPFRFGFPASVFFGGSLFYFLFISFIFTLICLFVWKATYPCRGSHFLLFLFLFNFIKPIHELYFFIF